MATPEDLFEAIRVGDPALVRSIVKQFPALASARSADGQSAVMRSAYANRPEIVSILIDAGASLDFFDACAAGNLAWVNDHVNQDPAALFAFSSDGWTALHLAAFFGHIEIARLLLAAGAPLEVASTNSHKNFPLQAAASGCRAEMVRFLLENGADANCRNSPSRVTPLHHAAACGHLEIVKTLLLIGADPKATDSEGRTPRVIAEAKGHALVAAALKMAGA